MKKTAITVDPRPGGDERAEHVGALLRRKREARGIPLEDVALRTKIKIDFLQHLEEGRLGELPAEVFVRGFVRAYARTVGADADEALRRIGEQYGGPQPEREITGERPLPSEPSVIDGRRRVGVVLVVVVILIAATVTLSLLLRPGRPAPGGLSSLDRSAPAIEKPAS